MIKKADDDSDQHIIILCNAIGTPVDSKTTEVEPRHIVMTPSHVCVASDSHVYIWQYRLANPTDSRGLIGTSLLRKEGKERVFFADETPVDNGKLDINRKQV